MTRGHACREGMNAVCRLLSGCFSHEQAGRVRGCLGSCPVEHSQAHVCCTSPTRGPLQSALWGLPFSWCSPQRAAWRAQRAGALDSKPRSGRHCWWSGLRDSPGRPEASTAGRARLHIAVGYLHPHTVCTHVSAVCSSRGQQARWPHSLNCVNCGRTPHVRQ